MCAQPITGQAQSVAQDTEQIHGKHGSGALLSSLLLVVVIAAVGCESGASGKLVGTSVELVAGCRRNEQGTRCWSKVADCPLVAGRDAQSQSVP